MDFLFFPRKGKIRILLDVRACPGDPDPCVVSPFATTSELTVLPVVAWDAEARCPWVFAAAASFVRAAFDDERE